MRIPLYTYLFYEKLYVTLLYIYLCRFRCITGESSVISVVNVILLVSRTDSVHTATLLGGFRYTVSYLCGLHILLE